MILPAKPKRTRIQHDSSELESSEYEWQEDGFSSLDTDSDDVNVEDRGTLEKLLTVWSKLLLPVQESEIVGKWFAGMYETKNDKFFYIGCLLKRFLGNDRG